MIEILRANITTLAVDAIVNAANAELFPGGGVSGAIHRAAGPDLEDVCRSIGGCEIGGAVITPGFALPARFIIHAVGPIWRGGTTNEHTVLRRTYQSIFHVARANPAIRTLAIPAISTGIYAFPKNEAAVIAMRAMRDNEDAFDRLIACLFEEESASLYRRELDGAQEKP